MQAGPTCSSLTSAGTCGNSTLLLACAPLTSSQCGPSPAVAGVKSYTWLQKLWKGDMRCCCSCAARPLYCRL
jgi:hypothetical protein